MISAKRWSRRGLLAGTAILTAGGTAAKEDRLAEGVVILIDSNEPYVMGHAISYSANLSKHFAERGARLLIEVVANGKGIDVFRADKTPLGEPLATLRQSLSNLTYSMCASSKAIAEAKEQVSIPLIPGAILVPFGIGRVVDLQLKGWAYIHA
ncbi:DsrE family protein [Bradyrhizobium yuanmingense]|uniref:DsrE family protein n=1 Tax=Bradyrhizobium yuanmingense TaxID=108015 RepID=UPI0023B9A346|nr:DsrE family protein [Bradyrhizobium yuanmingense]MDF0520830.1 DsrE family protein [Bradyrhizobium yuanmingense]